jgi:hypothetical protein
MLEVQELDNVSLVKITAKLNSIEELISTSTQLIVSNSNVIVSIIEQIKIENNLLQKLEKLSVLANDNKCSFLIADLNSNQINAIENYRHCLYGRN